jgi:chaperonin GroES
MSEKYTPLHDRIVVRREQEVKTVGGIFIPESAREKSQTGFVLAIGKGRYNKEGNLVPLEVKVGDRVMFGKYAGTETPRFNVEIGGEELLIMKEDEIFLILPAETANTEKKPEKVGAARR